MNYKDIGFKKRTIKYIYGLLSLFIIICFVQCSDGEDSTPLITPTPNPGESLNLSDIRLEIARHAADHFILPGFDGLANQGSILKEAISTLDTDLNPDNLSKAREELKSLWLNWQTVSLFQLGPTETNALRSSINTYPTDTIKIEANITTGTWNLGTLDNGDAEGLPAIDYLLNKYSDQDDILLNEFTVNPMRLNYLKDLTEYLFLKIERVKNEWQQGDFLTNFTSNQSNGTDVGSALGLIVNSIDIHFQRFLRDGKIAIPSGVRSAGIPRPQAVEAFYGGYSRTLLEESISAYIHLFEGQGTDGTMGTSLVDYLKAIDQIPLGNEILQSLQQNLQLAKALDVNLSLQINTDNDKMIDLFISLQNTTSIIKSDMSSVMGITITNQDNDGD